MTDADVLVYLKANLEIYPENTTQDHYLAMLITTAKEEITREGITLDMNEFGDVNLVVMYAAYLWRKRASDGAERYNTTAQVNVGMPRMLRYALNNRLFSQKMRGAQT